MKLLTYPYSQTNVPAMPVIEFGPTHLNVKNLAAVSYGWSREVGMSEALRRLGLPLEGTHHRGGDDAWNIAGLLCHLLQRIRRA